MVQNQTIRSLLGLYQWIYIISHTISIDGNILLSIGNKIYYIKANQIFHYLIYVYLSFTISSLNQFVVFCKWSLILHYMVYEYKTLYNIIHKTISLNHKYMSLSSIMSHTISQNITLKNSPTWIGYNINNHKCEKEIREEMWSK